MDDRQRQFVDRVWEYYHDNGRDLPWRHNPTPYQVFVSEVMLQQTQVARVLVKYPKWLAQFPSFEVLAAAAVSDVVAAWQGLGYNRRVLWLQRAAREVVEHYGGELPRDPVALVTLPGIGPNTAGSIAAFAYNEPTVFIETNIRRVYIHEFLGVIPSEVERPIDRSFDTAQGDKLVHDRDLLPLIEATLDRDNPREWYYALMDYGADLAGRVPNPNRRSRHYAVQSQFEGSLRQIRGEVLRQLVGGAKSTAQLGIADDRLERVLADLARDGFIEEHDSHWRLVDK